MRRVNSTLRTPEIKRRRKKRNSRSRAKLSSKKKSPSRGRTMKKVLNPSRSETLKNIALEIPDKTYGSRLYPSSKKKKSNRSSRSRSSRKSSRRKRRLRSKGKRLKRGGSRRRKKKSRSRSKNEGKENGLTREEIESFIHEKLKDFSPDEKDFRVNQLVKITTNASLSEHDRDSLIDILSSPQKNNIEKINENEVKINGETFISKKMFEELKQNTLIEAERQRKKELEDLKKIKIENIDKIDKKSKDENSKSKVSSVSKRTLRSNKDTNRSKKSFKSKSSNSKSSLKKPKKKPKDKLLNIVYVNKNKENEDDYSEEEVGPTYEEFKTSRNRNSNSRKNLSRKRSNSRLSNRYQSSNKKNFNSGNKQKNFYEKYYVLTQYHAIVKKLKLPKVHFAFRPRTWPMSKKIKIYFF